MPRPRRGRRLPNGTVVLAGSTSTSINQMRCSCGGLAVPVGTTAGKPIYQCGTCQSKFQSKKF